MQRQQSASRPRSASPAIGLIVGQVQWGKEEQKKIYLDPTKSSNIGISGLPLYLVQSASTGQATVRSLLLRPDAKVLKGSLTNGTIVVIKENGQEAAFEWIGRTREGKMVRRAINPMVRMQAGDGKLWLVQQSRPDKKDRSSLGK